MPCRAAERRLRAHAHSPCAPRPRCRQGLHRAQATRAAHAHTLRITAAWRLRPLRPPPLPSQVLLPFEDQMAWAAALGALQREPRLSEGALERTVDVMRADVSPGPGAGAGTSAGVMREAGPHAHPEPAGAPCATWDRAHVHAPHAPSARRSRRVCGTSWSCARG